MNWNRFNFDCKRIIEDTPPDIQRELDDEHRRYARSQRTVYSPRGTYAPRTLSESMQRPVEARTARTLQEANL